MNNLYQVKKHSVIEKGTDKTLSVYYSIGRYRKLFFNLFGPYIWWDFNELHYRKHPISGYYASTLCNFVSYEEAVEVCDDFNGPLIEKCEREEIVYEG